MNSNKRTKSVLVVGAGIAGIQAALDLAELGADVYLVEETPSIGGRMPQLDKTFPTNDCSICILAPKMVEAGRHPNIKLLTNSEIEEVSGYAGNFKAKIRKKAPFIDWEKCTGCGDCPKVCPVNIKDDFNVGLSYRKSIYRPFPQAVPNKFTIDKQGTSPCRFACPAGVNAQGYINLIREGKYKEALALEMEGNPFPSVCGRVCTHPCETECKRSEVDAPLSIRALKRFIADKEIEREKPEVHAQDKGKVAIIGSGPSGLTCAYELAKQGYKTTVFESLPVIGGMLITGIPAFRLPREALKKDIDYIIDWGVEIKTNALVNDPEKLLNDGYDAVYIATGAHLETKMGIEGEDLEGVYYGIEFLRKVNLGEKVKVGEKVAIIGGGNSAIDAARTALRLGAKETTIVYRRSRGEMPANEEEIEMAEEEGIEIQFLTLPRRIIGNGKVEQIECIRMKLGEPDASGRRRPIPIEGSEFIVDVNTVIPTIGQTPDTSYLPRETNLNLHEKWNSFIVDEDTLQTTVPGIFAGGDAVSGPDTVIKAIAAGKEAAISIDRYIRGIDLKETRKKELKKAEVEIPMDIVRRRREKVRVLEVSESIKGFEEVDLGLTEEQAKREAERCLNCGGCCECMQCVEACEAEAVKHDQKEEIIEEEVGAVVVATGYDIYPIEKIGEYGGGKYKNVISALQFERLLSASGPQMGHIVRLSDGKPPKRIAFIQCVGSRNVKIKNDYCSSACCMYAIKEAVIAKEHAKDIESYIFFMDIRAFGKDFDKYYEHAKELGIKFIRCRVPAIEEVPDTKDLKIAYETESGELIKDVFNLVVLSVGLCPPKGVEKMAKVFGVELNNYGFCGTQAFDPLATIREGIFVAGVMSGPKDIPESVMAASGAVAECAKFLALERQEKVSKKEYPPEINVIGDRPRIGVFVCHCGINIAGVVDVNSVVEFAKGLPNVEYTQDTLYTCSQDSLDIIKQKIKEYNLNRVLVAACTPRTHEPLFRETLREAGLNQYLFEMANIRDQCSWAHMNEPDLATEKAKDLVGMGVAKARELAPLYRFLIQMTPKALVIGGGLSGTTTALAIAETGYEVSIIEKENELGGNLRNIYWTLDGNDPQELLQDTVKKVIGNPLIKVYTNAKIENISGYIGNFKTTIKTDDKLIRKQVDKKTTEGTYQPINLSTYQPIEIEHGAIIVATGAEEHKTQEYMYGKSTRVMTQLDFEKWLSAKTEHRPPKTVVMIQCVDSREEDRFYCSRVCCAKAIKNSLELKKIYPNTQIYILYRDIRTYGFKEKYYTKARDNGVLFIRYEPEQKPQVELITQEDPNSRLKITTIDPLLGDKVVVEADLLVLSVAIDAPPQNKELAKMLKVPLNADGFYLEAHVKLRPVDFATDGIFVCGLAHGPKDIDESITQAKGAAGRALTLLSKQTIEAEGTISWVNSIRCSACGVCEKVCAYSAIEIKEKTLAPGIIKRVAEINEALCKGCGACAASCRCGAIDLRGFSDTQIFEAVGAI